MDNGYYTEMLIRQSYPFYDFLNMIYYKTINDYEEKKNGVTEEEICRIAYKNVDAEKRETWYTFSSKKE